MSERRGEMLRLLDESKSDFERTLLESGAKDQPDGAACDRALAGLGLGAPVVLASVSGVAAGSAAKGTGAAGSAVAGAPVVKASGIVIAKWVGLAIVGGAVAVGSLHSSSPAAPRAATPVVAAPVLPHAAVVASTRAPAAPPELIVPRERPLPAPVAAHAPPAVLASAIRPVTSDLPSVGVLTPSPAFPKTPSTPSAGAGTELEALRVVRLTIDRGDATEAIGLVDAFEAQHPGSAMEEEAQVLRIDACVRAGRRAEASSLAAEFFRAHPESAYTDHVQSKLKSP